MEIRKLFTIGDVAKMFHLSVSSLHYYEKAGLLTPEYINPDTGYRYYSTRQFEVLNTIRYLRMLDMPLSEIADFLQNRDVERIEQKLRQQKETVLDKQRELRRIERKIDNRLQQLEDARSSVFDTVRIVHKTACRMVFVRSSLKICHPLDMEIPVLSLNQEESEALVFLGKVGIGISQEHLTEGCYDQYDMIFLMLDEEDQYDGVTLILSPALCVSIRFCGTHMEAPQQYARLMDYIRRHQMTVSGFSREITMIDYGLTSDTEQFVTEISIPVTCD